MQTITIRRNALRAMLHLAGDRDVRSYLNGVLVEANATATRLVATDGHVLGVFEQPAPKKTPNEVAGVVQIIVPRETLALLKADRKALPRVTLTWDETAPTVAYGAVAAAELDDSGRRIGFTPIDGKFPDYTATIPHANPSGEAAQFDVALLDRFVKVARLLGVRCPETMLDIAHNGPDRAAAVTIHGAPEFAGVIGPLRTAGAGSVAWAAKLLRADDAQPEARAA